MKRDFEGPSRLQVALYLAFTALVGGMLCPIIMSVRPDHWSPYVILVGAVVGVSVYLPVLGTMRKTDKGSDQIDSKSVLEV
ncbi:MAG: hypothetical protein E7A62_03045 [Actinomycetaceae bacterium]|nr:hypothetical protein [Actinomycetaceae bacterium]MDU0969959.1 hypothetical protein [Actinomycetaceae bacterium]